MRIGEIAKKAHVSASIIRYYERKGILPPAVRDAFGYRDYGESDLARVELVRGARHLGCSFAEIKAITALEDMPNVHTSHILDLLMHKVAEVGSEIDRLRFIQLELSRLRDLALTLDDSVPA